MPFKSLQQLRTCYGKLFKGDSSWDCDKWIKETKNPWTLPENSSDTRIKRKKFKEPDGQSCHSGRKLCVGPRGGKFIVRGGIRISAPRNIKRVPLPSPSKSPSKSARKSARKSDRKSARKSSKKSERKSAGKSTRKSERKSAKKSLQESPRKSKFDKMTVKELKELARDRGYSGYSKLLKADLINLLRTKGTKSKKKLIFRR